MSAPEKNEREKLWSLQTRFFRQYVCFYTNYRRLIYWKHGRTFCWDRAVLLPKHFWTARSCPHSTAWKGCICELLAATRLSAPFSMKGVVSALYRVKWGAMWTAGRSAVVCPLQYERDAIRTLQRERNTMRAVRLLSYWYLLRCNSSFPKQKKKKKTSGTTRSIFLRTQCPEQFDHNPRCRMASVSAWTTRFVVHFWTGHETKYGIFFFVLLSIEHRFVQCVFARTISTRFAKVECSVFRVNRLLPKGKSICTTYGYVTDTSVSKNTHNGIITLWQTGTNMTITFFFFKLHLNFVQRSVLNTFLSACPLWGVCVSSKIFFLV